MNFDYLACVLVVLPLLAYFYCSLDRRLINPEDEVTAQRKLRTIANTAGIAGVLALSFFLIPVTRHSVLLVALGWSPVQALRLHVWAGFTSFFFIALHAICYVIDWFAFQEESIWEQIIPDRSCWKWANADVSRECNHKWYNFSGIVASFFFMALIVSSLNWFRRKYYRIFYICHVFFGTAMILMAILHWRPLVTYLIPSIVYYLASTTPTLVQAVTSFVRGGVILKKVIPLVDGGGCLEVHLATTSETNAILARESCLFVKVCVPKHSLVWHPFTVFRLASDPTTVRLIFRPVGPFTETLAQSLLEDIKPRVLVDGFYRGGDRVLDALQHDQVTILAGGVAITPFLSMVPMLLSRMKSKESQKCRSICFHWIVRELGLKNYIQQTYLDKFVDAANESGIVLRINIHLTGSCKDDAMDNGMKLCDDDNDDDTASKSNKNVPVKKSESLEIAEASDENRLPKSRLGAAMEVGRLMPARHKKVSRNIPYTMAFSLTLWLCYEVIFAWYQSREYKVNSLYARVFGVAIALCVALGVGMAIEIIALLCGSFSFPEATDDNSESLASAAFNTDGNMDAVESVGSALIELYQGRPSPETLLADATLAEAPGVFLCGPRGMSKSVRKYASKENSVLGLTRYCLYEEPFEM